MEPRKLIRLGNSSFAIALPKDWIDKSVLKKGDDVYIERDSNGGVNISSKFKKEEEKRIEINIDSKTTEDSFKKYLHAAYTQGYNVVVLKGKPKSSKFLKNLLSNYLSYEIIESNDKEVVIRDFFDFKEAKFENFVKRIDTNLREMFNIILSEFQKEKINAKNFSELEEIDEEVNKFYFLCSRIFIKGIDNPTIMNILKISGNELFNNWWLSFHLESLGDGLKYISREIIKTRPEMRVTVYEILSKVFNGYVSCMESFYNKNSDKAFNTLTDIKQIKEEINDLREKNLKDFRILEALELVRKNIYQNTKIIFYMR